MPTSQPDVIPLVVSQLIRAHPNTVLDIGCGWGKYGVLAREYLELWREDTSLERDVFIDAIEAHEPYIGLLHRAVYDNVHVGDALALLPTLPNYDYILLIDVLEHFTKEEGNTLLDLCAVKGDKTLVVTPFKPRAQGASYGNEYETHRSKWSLSDFDRFATTHSMSSALVVEMGAK